MTNDRLKRKKEISQTSPVKHLKETRLYVFLMHRWINTSLPSSKPIWRGNLNKLGFLNKSYTHALLIDYHLQ